MICRETEDRMLERLAGVLPPALGEELDAHLKACGACRRLAARLKASVRDLEGAFAGLEPRDLTTAVLSRVQTSAPKRWGVLSPVFAGGSLALILALAVFFGTQRGLSDQALLQAYAEDLKAIGWSPDDTFASTETSSQLDGLSEYLLF